MDNYNIEYEDDGGLYLDMALGGVFLDFLRRNAGEEAAKDWDQLSPLPIRPEPPLGKDCLMRCTPTEQIGEAIAYHLLAAQRDMPDAGESELAGDAFLRIYGVCNFSSDMKDKVLAKFERRKDRITIMQLPILFLELLDIQLPLFNYDSDERVKCVRTMMDFLRDGGFRYEHFTAYARYVGKCQQYKGKPG